MKICRILLVLMTCLTLSSAVRAGHPCAHILICCRDSNNGVTFEVNGKFIEDHNYGDIEQVRDILQKLKDAGIKSVIVDMTNPSQWLRLWGEFEPMVDNVAQVCREKELQFFLHIGGGFSPGVVEENKLTQSHLVFWNDIAEKIWNKWAQEPEYRRYGFGDDRPILLIFSLAKPFWKEMAQAAPEEKAYLGKFHLGTMQINGVIKDPGESDGWGYRSKWQNKSGSVRYTSPNGGVPPSTWHKIDTKQWEKEVRWVSEASEYSIYGSYDDTCDSIFWGIADTSGTSVKYNLYPDSKNPRYYYDVIQKILTQP